MGGIAHNRSFAMTGMVSLLTDHLVITPKYRGKILTGDVAFVAEGIIRGTCLKWASES